MARGESRSIPLDSVLEEVRAAVRAGVQEAVLTGVQLGSWGKELHSPLELTDLVLAVLEKTEIPRLRLSSIEPWDVPPSLINLIQEKRVARHLHLPLQSGSAAVLHRMARANTPAQYADLVNRIREVVPDIALTTDIMIGFPGESDAEFAESLDFIRQMEFADGHVFTYSAREGTPAAEFPDQVPHPVRKQRSAQIRDLLALGAVSYREKFVGSEIDNSLGTGGRKNGRLAKGYRSDRQLHPGRSVCFCRCMEFLLHCADNGTDRQRHKGRDRKPGMNILMWVKRG